MSEAPNRLKTIPGGNKPQIQSEGDLNKIMSGRIMPQAIDLEEAVIGAILIDKDAMPSVIEILRPDSFYLPKHQIMYEIMWELFSKSLPIDLLTLHESLKKAGKLD